MKMLKKVMLFMLMLVCCSTLTGCKFFAVELPKIEGSSSIAIRVGLDPNDAFKEAIEVVPFGEKSSAMIVTYLQSNTNKSLNCKIVITTENVADVVYAGSKGCIEDSISISNNTIEYEVESNKYTSTTPIELQFNFEGLEKGKSIISIKVYDHNGDLVYSACAEKVLTFE